MADYYAGLGERYRQLLARYDSALIPEQLASDLATELQTDAPKDTGTLAEAVSEVGPAVRTEGAWTIGVGNATRTGSPEARTPGTIAAFLASSEGRELMKAAKREAAKRRRAGKKAGMSLVSGFEKRLAWWMLPQDSKDALKDARRQGRFGGPSYASGAPARYYFVQSGDKANWRDSAFSAGLENHVTYFTTNALTAWRTRIGDIIRRAIA